MWLLCSFQGPWRGLNTGRLRVLLVALFSRVLAAPAGAGLSKLNSMLALFAAFAVSLPQVVTAAIELGHPARFGRHARPDPAWTSPTSMLTLSASGPAEPQAVGAPLGAP